MSFDPRRIQRFVFGQWTWNPQRGQLTLPYRLDDYCFEETIRFAAMTPVIDEARNSALARCFDLIHLLAGVSYYKAAVPPVIAFEGAPPEPMLAAFAERVYRNGLGEFAFRNRIDLSDRIHIPCGMEGEEPDPVPLDSGLVIPLGGGKDSLVTVETLRKAGESFRLISVGEAGLIDEVATAVATPHIRIERRLSDELFRINQSRAYNGHVPISAILASIMTAGALLYGYDQIVMSNEQSAEAANVVLDDGFEVNHQFSKSLRFETDFQHLIDAKVLPGFRYFSLLRPLSELEIARRFAGMRNYHRVFSSCNRNFRLTGDRGQRWCQDCPKCRFVYLALAPFMDRETLIGVFGGNLLDDPGQLNGYQELLGLSGMKPFECVGEIDESRSAFKAIAGKDNWREDCVVQALSGNPAVDQAQGLDYWLRLRGEHAMTQRFADHLDAV